jgi:hypothetical protein
MRCHKIIRMCSQHAAPARSSGVFEGTKPGSHTFGGPASISFVGSVNSDIGDSQFKSDAPAAQLYDLEADVN